MRERATKKEKCSVHVYRISFVPKKKGSRKDTRSDVSLIVFRVTYLRYEDGEGEDRGEEEIKAGIVRWQRSCGLRTVER